MSKKHLTDDEAAALAGVSVRTLERWVKAGAFPMPDATAKDGRSRARLWSAAEVRAWIKNRPAYKVEQGPFPGSRMGTPFELAAAYLLHSDLAAGVAVPGARLRAVDDPGWQDAVLVEVDTTDGGVHVVALGVKGWRPKLPSGSWAPLPPVEKIHGFTFKLKAGGDNL